MMNAIGYAILFTAHHNIDVLSTIQHLQYQGVAPSQIMLFQGSSSIPTISYEPVAVADKETARSLTKTYAWYLKEASKNFLYTVILEDDLKISPNFVTYMLWGQRVLKYAPDVAVVSAWNDNAVPEVILSPSLVWKVRQFMGLGWIASAETLLALSRAIANAPGQPWDTTTGKYMLKNNLLSVFPQFPRVHHRTVTGCFINFKCLKILGAHCPVHTSLLGDTTNTCTMCVTRVIYTKWMSTGICTKL